MNIRIQLLLILLSTLQATGCAMLVSVPRATVNLTNSPDALATDSDSLTSALNLPDALDELSNVGLKPKVTRAPIVMAAALKLEEKASSAHRRQRDINFAKAQEQAVAKLEQKQLRMSEPINRVVKPVSTNSNSLQVAVPQALVTDNSVERTIHTQGDITLQGQPPAGPQLCHESINVGLSEATSCKWYDSALQPMQSIAIAMLVFSGLTWPWSRLGRRWWLNYQVVHRVATSKNVGSNLESFIQDRSVNFGNLPNDMPIISVSCICQMDWDETSLSDNSSAFQNYAVELTAEVPVQRVVRTVNIDNAVILLSDITVPMTNSLTSSQTRLQASQQTCPRIGHSSSLESDSTRHRQSACRDLILATPVRVHAKAPLPLLRYHPNPSSLLTASIAGDA